MHDAGPLPRLPARDPSGHKGTFGTVAVLGGCALAESRMIGGPAMSALAALRSGAGLARLVMPSPVLDAAMTIAPSATGVAIPVDHRGEIVPHEAARAVDEAVNACTALVIGPGLGRGAGPTAAALRAAMQEDRPVVIDADALNALASTPEVRRDFRAHAVLTPHPGEFKRLATALGIERDADESTNPEKRAAAAERLAQSMGAVVVLKGAGTVVTDGARTWINTGGSAALATAGTGDVLSGVVGALIAQHHRAPLVAGSRTVTSEQRGGLGLFDCARLAVHAHAMAADQWVDWAGVSAGMLATDLLDELPAALEALRGEAADGISSPE